MISYNGRSRRVKAHERKAHIGEPCSVNRVNSVSPATSQSKTDSSVSPVKCSGMHTNGRIDIEARSESHLLLDFQSVNGGRREDKE